MLSIKDSLKRALFETTASGRQPILFIDEAQLLPEPLLQTLRSLLNYQLDERKLLCIALSGQPELRDMVVRHPNFGDRVAFWLELGALSEAESAGLVHHRLRRAGFSASQSPFDDEALHVLWIKSAGIPRRLTTLARESLEVGAEYGRRQIRAADVLVAVERIVPLAATLRSDNGIAASSSRPATWSLRRLWQRFTGAL